MNASPLPGWLLIGAAFAIFVWRSARLLKPMRAAQPADRFDQPGLRLKGVLRAVGLHERLLKARYSGVLHAMILASFIVLSTAILQAFGAALIPGFSLAPVGGDSWIALLQDVFALVVSAAVAMAMWQRFVIRPARFAGSNATDATIIYALIAAIVVSMLLQAAFDILARSSVSASWRPVSSLIASGLASLDVSIAGAAAGAHAMFWAHICAILAFLVYIPGSKHRHMFLAAPNIYFRSLKPKGQSPPAPPKLEGGELAAAKSLLSWKDLLDVYSCTECGRCQAACPAYAAGLPLSPKQLMMTMRDHALAAPTGPLVGGSVSEATLWACTTCRACMEVCPVHIEHVPKIVAMRRVLVDEGKIAPMLQDALSNLQRTGNSMGVAPKMRARWTRDLPFKIKDARKEPVDILWFVGDFAAYDQRVQLATRKVAMLLHKAGVDFGILYDGEQNSGNDVRRVGEEGLFEMLAQHNIEALAGAQFNRIMTTDPHSLNALRQEYPALGANYEVAHYAQILVELIESGRLAVKPNAGEIVTYHDPCYLGRYNGDFDAPRKLIGHAGYKLHEMGRCRENSFCCGAGGGRIWADDSQVKERPSEIRIREALALGDARHFVVACPKDKVMYAAAIQALGVEDRLDVLDLADLLLIEESDAIAAPAMSAP
jgi:Fe-S oxidoreductase